MGKTQDMIALLEGGFRPYTGRVPRSFYLERKCYRPSRAEWYCRPGNVECPHMHCVCLGCRRKCAAFNPKDWPILAKFDKSAREETVFFALVEQVSVETMLRLKRVLRVEEAAWALNVGPAKVRRWAEEGVLETVPGHPVRVTTASVRRNLEPL
jgi:hypothetical protein